MRTRAELQKRPLPLEIFRRVQRAILRLVAARYSAHWGARRAQLNRITLLDMIRVLLGHGRFVLGERVAFTNWAPGEPNNLGDEDAVQVHPHGTWNDANVGGPIAACLVEIPR